MEKRDDVNSAVISHVAKPIVILAEVYHAVDTSDYAVQMMERYLIRSIRLEKLIEIINSESVVLTLSCFIGYCVTVVFIYEL